MDRARPQYDFPFNTIIGLSARFPLYLARWMAGNGLKDSTTGLNEKKRLRINDGGYYENSGAGTLLDMVENLRSTLPQDVVERVSFVHIAITSLDLTLGSHPHDISRFSESSDEGVGEALSPIRTMMRTRFLSARVRRAQTVRAASIRLS